MKTYTLAGVIGWIIALAVGVVLWIFVMVAVIHVFGCTVNFVESGAGPGMGVEVHHQSDPTPTP